MIAVYLKELQQFFSHLTGYLAMSVFLTLSGLFVWIFPDSSILDNTFAHLDPFFITAPWVLLLLIPALTMRLFAEEFQQGTYELLRIRPIGLIDIILGKYLATLTLLLFSLLPTAVYFYSVHQLGNPPGNLDTGAIYGSYFGLFLLGAAFAAIGLFASATAPNQIVAFILAIVLCFFMYIGFYYISSLPVFFGRFDDLIASIGMEAHYQSLSRGVIDSRDLIYFLSVILFFILTTRHYLWQKA